MSEAKPDSEKNKWHHTHSTNTMRQASADRESRLERRPTGRAYTRHPAVKTSTYIPFSVREAHFRKEGYKGGDAKRMARFQTSSAGLDMAAQGGIADPRMNPPGASGMVRTDVQATNQKPSGQGAAPASPADAATTAAPQPRRNLSEIEQAQANFEAAREKVGALPEGAERDAAIKDFLQKRKKADAFAKSKGWKFDPKTGYSNPGVNDAGYMDTLSFAKPSTPTPRTDEPGGGSASFTMPDGTVRTVTGDRDISEQFADIRTPGPVASSSAPAATDLGGASVPQTTPPTTAKNTRTLATVDTPEIAPADGAFAKSAPKVPSAKEVASYNGVPLYTGGDVVTKQIEANKAKNKNRQKGSRKTVVSIDVEGAKRKVRNLIDGKTPQGPEIDSYKKRQTAIRKKLREQPSVFSRLAKMWGDADEAKEAREAKRRQMHRDSKS